MDVVFSLNFFNLDEHLLILKTTVLWWYPIEMFLNPQMGVNFALNLYSVAEFELV